MGLIVDEKNRRKIENGKRVIFNLLAETGDFHEDNDEGTYQCWIKIFDENNNIIDEFYRYFLVSKFNKNHYFRFIDHFCNDIGYREQFNIKNDIKEDRDKSMIDERLIDIITKLNELGLVTKFSCQGTDNEWKDRPGKTDGHSGDAYIGFEESLPSELQKLLGEDKRLQLWGNTIRSTKRQYNSIFPSILSEIISEWKKV